MSRQHIWDEAFALLEQFEANEAEPEVNEAEPEVSEAEPEVSEAEPEVNEAEPEVNEAEPEVNEVEPEVNETEPEVNEAEPGVNEAEPGDQEIAFREITEENSINLSADFLDKLHENEVSFKNDDVPDKVNEGDISLRNAGETIDPAIIDLEAMDFKDGISIKSAKELYYEIQNNLFKSFHLIKDDKDFSIDTVFTYAADMVSHIKEKANSWMQLLYKIEKDTGPDAVMHIVKHSLDSAIIAIRIGIGLKLDDDRLEALAMQTCLHDVGMLKLQPELILKQGKLPREEMDLIKKHPEYGHEILSKYERKYRGIAEVIYQEHERYDGSGYPRGMKGDNIPEHSLIIGMSDTFAALLHPRPYRPRRLPFEAIKEIIAAAKHQFPKHIIKALVNEFSAFPEGLYVKLNSNEIGKVITVNRLAPLSPVVELLYNAEGKLHDTKIVDLMKDHCLYIKSGFYGEDD
jgi:HD-GYP domain-containing protein (c-di-GMP phosphodiesterase class II)